MEDRFEDVPQELDEIDRAGSVKITSYYEYYKHIVFYPDKNDNIQPAGMWLSLVAYTFAFSAMSLSVNADCLAVHTMTSMIQS